MTSPGHYRRRAVDNDDEQTGSRFFKIILQSTILEKKLFVPRKFVRDSAGCLLYSKSATLKVPSGDEWEVELGREGEDVWFGNNGWQRFAGFYSLQHGSLLVFEYSGRSEFSVAIFGRSATEIDYPVREVIGIEDSAPMEVLDVLDEDIGKTNQWNGNSRGKPPMVPNRDVEVAQGNSRLVKRQKRCWRSSGGFDESKGGLNKAVMLKPQKEKQGSSEKPLCSRKRRALPLEGFTTKQPASYKTKMHPSYIATGPYIPVDFAEEHIKKTEQQVKLVVGGNEWTVRLTKLQSKYTKLGFGWKGFAEDNSLKCGDVCNFELIHGWTNVKLKVAITRDLL